MTELVGSPEFCVVAVLEICSDAGPPLSGLDAILRLEMLHFHASMPDLIAVQDPLISQERTRGARTATATHASAIPFLYLFFSLKKFTLLVKMH
jgi:hypothetical protein